MTDLLTYLFIGYVGVLIHILTKAEEDRDKPGFTMGGFLKDNLIHTILCAITAPVLIYSCWADPLMSSYFPPSIPMSLVIGYTSQSVLKFVVNRYKPKK